MNVLLVTLLALLVFFYIRSRGRGQAYGVPSYFFNAVKVYALLGEEDAKSRPGPPASWPPPVSAA